MTTLKIANQGMEFFRTNVKSSVSKNDKPDFSSYFEKTTDKVIKSSTSAIKGNNSKDGMDTNPSSYVNETTKVSNEKPIGSTESMDVTRDVSSDVTLKEGETEQKLKSKLEELMVFIGQTLLSQLNITKEELDAAMEQLGFSSMDMLNEENRKQFVLEMNGLSDLTSILTDENLLETITNINKEFQTDNLANELDISTDEFANLLVEANKKLESAKASNVLEVDQEDTNIHSFFGNESLEVEVINEKTAATLSNSQDDGKDEASSKLVNPEELKFGAFIQNDANTVQFDTGLDAITQIKEIVNQIVEQIKIHIKPDQTSMELQLNPENLGKIHVSVTEKDGILTAEFKTQNYIVKEAVESQMMVLKENLNQQGLKVEAIEVTVSNFDFNQNGGASTAEQNNQGSKRPHFFFSDNEIASSESENFMNEVMEQSGSSVNYTA